MNKKVIFLSILLMTLLWNSSSVLSAGDADDDMDIDDVVDHCTTPTAEIDITAEELDLAYTASEYHVEKNTCYELIFENLSEIEHDVSIDDVHGLEGIEAVHIHLDSNTDGENGVKTLRIQTPDADTEFEIYCSVAGHKQAGMVATLIVGDGFPADDDEGSLPLNLLASIFGLALISLVIKIKRN